jgi:hypothetical protein
MESEMKTILGAFLVIALTASPSLAARKVWSQQGTHHVYKYGWGWDSRWGGYYVGPIFKGNQKGYFRCLIPGYGWRRC